LDVVSGAIAHGDRGDGGGIGEGEGGGVVKLLAVGV
jgi:hypothetical protein